MRRTLILGIMCLCTTGLAADSSTTASPPQGFGALFNGTDLAGWIGVPHLDPRKLRAMGVEEREQYLAKNWEEVEKHWSVENGELVNDGQGPYLTTAKDYGDFELLLDYKTVPKADSGIYLRGTPQVQIWDTTQEGGKWDRMAQLGSAGLFNNQKAGTNPLVLADNPFGEWNSLRITMVGETVSVWLNGKMTVNEVDLENYWDRTQNVFPLGPIQLQTHGGEIRFRNVYLKEIARKPPEAGYLTAEGEPYGDAWVTNSGNKAVKEFTNASNTTLGNDTDLHFLFTAEGPAELSMMPTEQSRGVKLTLSQNASAVLTDERDETAAVLAQSPVKLGAGPQHLYLRTEGDHLQVWLNEESVIDVLLSNWSGPWKMGMTGMNIEQVHLRDRADDPVQKPTAEAGQPIYDGSFANWTGDVDGYEAQPNIIRSKQKGGDLFYAPELSNFRFSFDFQLTPGGNNGVGLRVPPGGHAAYDGMESQILDNASPMYKGIKPWQAHGSIYGIIPAKRGYLKPVGHWNHEEITVRGRDVTVVLNGKTIVEGNLDAATSDGSIDSKEHPGLTRTNGQIGFLGHGHAIGFRNLRVETLDE